MHGQQSVMSTPTWCPSFPEMLSELILAFKLLPIQVKPEEEEEEEEEEETLKRRNKSLGCHFHSLTLLTNLNLS